MPKGGPSQELTIKNFRGVNLKDAGDRIADNEFVALQNLYQPSKGIFSRRWGSVADQTSFALCSRLSGVWRHYAPNGERFSLYHCVPDATQLPDNTLDLVLTDIPSPATNGNIFGGGGSTFQLAFCYSWIGRGCEQTYNSKNRAGFPAGGSFPLFPSANPAHQRITPSSVNSNIQITVPAFPAGVVGANIFCALTGSGVWAMTYIGTVTQSGGSLILSECFAGLRAANADTLTLASPAPCGVTVNGGLLPPGTYWVACAWVTDPHIKEGQPLSGAGPWFNTTPLQSIAQVQVSGTQNAIQVTSPLASSTNGAQAIYVFIGTQDPNYHPLTCVGIIRSSSGYPSGATPTNYIDILSIPSHNVQSIPTLAHPDKNGPVFMNQVNDQWVGGINVSIGSRFQSRFGFLMASKNGGALKEVFPSRSLLTQVWNNLTNTIYAGDSFNLSPGVQVDLHNFAPQPKTQNDLHKGVNAGGGYVQPYGWGNAVNDPVFAYQLGLSYFVNGADVTWQTDGYTLSQMGPVGAASQTLLPPLARFIFVFQNGLIVAGALADNQVYGSNANAPNNWATGGTGTLQRFVTIGDARGSGVTATGIFTPATEATSNPGSFLISFKKNGTWMVSAISDPAASSIAGLIGGQVGSPMTQISGRVGCVAYRTVIQTPLGTIFLGQDGNVYLINRVAEPTRIGTKIQNGLLHLVGNDTAMKLCTAVYHDNHYKLSFPSKAALAANPMVNDSEWWADLRTENGDPITWVGPHTGRNIGPQVVLVGDSDDLSRLVADASVVRTYTADSTNSLADLAAGGGAQAIVWQCLSKIFRFGEEAHWKRHFGAIIDAYLDMSYTNALLYEGFADSYYQQVNRTLSSGGATWDVSQWDQTNYADAAWQGFSFMFGQTNLVGRTFQFRLTNSNQAPFALQSITLLMKPERRRLIA